MKGGGGKKVHDLLGGARFFAACVPLLFVSRVSLSFSHASTSAGDALWGGSPRHMHSAVPREGGLRCARC